MPTGGHAGLGLKLRVELSTVGMDLGHIEAADEVRDEAGSVPCGPGGELTLLNKQGVSPALVGQVVQQTDTHGAAADDHALSVVAHRCSHGCSDCSNDGPTVAPLPTGTDGS